MGPDGSSAGAADPSPLPAAPSLVILGTDALLAAQPASAVQLAHACLRLGYQAVVPASWGDELIAGGCLKQLSSRRSGGDGVGPAIFCACPYVAHRLLAAGRDLAPFLASFVTPPVAVARYLRALYGPTRLRLTYVGRCPGATDDTIDARLTPDELLAVIAERGVDLADQPRVFDSVIPPDRRRFLSQPGGFPAPDALRRIDPDSRVVEVTGPELVIELAQHLLSKTDVLIDVATRLGCVCSGAVPGVSAEGARARVTALEPPRAGSRIVDDRVPVAIDLPLPAATRDPIDVVPSVVGQRASGTSSGQPAADSPTPAAVGSRRSPTHGVTVRQPPGAMPTTRSGEGRALPRAYVARRGSGARSRGPNTPPRGEAPQRLGASGAAGGRAANGGSRRDGDGGRAVPPPGRAERAEPSDHAEWTDRAEIPAPATPPSPLGAPSGEVLVREKEPRPVAAAIGAAPDHAADPHGEPFIISDEVVAEAARAAAGLRAPAPISEVGVTPAASFRTRSTTFARKAVSAARQRRTAVAALLAVALLSASVGVLAGRWLAARAATAAAIKR
jgi:hypothetical protein